MISLSLFRYFYELSSYFFIIYFHVVYPCSDISDSHIYLYFMKLYILYRNKINHTKVKKKI